MTTTRAELWKWPLAAVFCLILALAYPVFLLGACVASLIGAVQGCTRMVQIVSMALAVVTAFAWAMSVWSLSEVNAAIVEAIGFFH